jgi:hypothetical protein
VGHEIVRLVHADKNGDQEIQEMGVLGRTNPLLFFHFKLNVSLGTDHIKNLFTEPLSSQGLLFWLHYSGFQASCHIAVSIRLLSNLRCCNAGITDRGICEECH